MTLIVNEFFYDPKEASRSYIVCAADRRIIQDGVVPHPDRRKQFRFKHLNAVVSYFGLADVTSAKSFETFLDVFSARPFTDIKECASTLATDLGSAILPEWMGTIHSGIHLAGFTKSGVPQFWFIRNIRGMDGVHYRGFLSGYTVSEELSEIHQKDKYDATTGTFTSAFGQWFANGDLRAYAPAWTLFDQFTLIMEQIGVSSPPTTADQVRDRVRWKMETIGHYYDLLSMQNNISPDIDTDVLAP